MSYRKRAAARAKSKSLKGTPSLTFYGTTIPEARKKNLFGCSNPRCSRNDSYRSRARDVASKHDGSVSETDLEGLEESRSLNHGPQPQAPTVYLCALVARPYIAPRTTAWDHKMMQFGLASRTFLLNHAFFCSPQLSFCTLPQRRSPSSLPRQP